MFFPRINYCQICTSLEIHIFRAYIKGEYFIDLSHGLSSKLKTIKLFIDACFVNNRPKRGRLQEQVLPPKVLDIVGQSSSGTNIVFEYKQILRFRKNGVCMNRVEGQLTAAKLQSTTETSEGRRPPKMSSRKKKLSSKSATRRK